jgi:hypothetical protein
VGVNANFVADFSTFLSALQAADVALADFGKGADTVGTKLNNMVDKFSGRQIIQQANELVVAIDKVGGATTLTANEQAKLNATLNEAIAKYQAIGEDVPPGMQKLADETKQASTDTTSWVGALESLAGAFGIAFSVGAVVNFGKELFADATALNTLSQQTRISVEDLQVLTAATADFGVGGEELGRALFNLQQRIAGGDQSVVHAYALMGISLDDLRDKDAKTLFLETERGLGTLAGALQDAAAKDLYGGKLGSSMVALSGGLDDAMAKTKDLNVATADSVKAMAEYSDAINRTSTSFKNWVTEGIGGAIGGIENLHKAMGQGGLMDDLKIVGAGWLDWAQTQITGVQHAEHLASVFDSLNQKTAENTKVTEASNQQHAAAKAPLDAHAEAIRYMETIQGQSGKALLDWQVQYLDQLRAIGQLDAQHASGIGVTVQQLDKYKAGLEAATKAQAELAKAQAEADAIALDSYNKRIKSLETVTQATLKAYSFDGQIGQLQALMAAEEDLARSVYAQVESEKTRMKILEDLAAKRTAIAQQMAALEAKHAQVVNQQVIDELGARAKVLEAYGQNVDGTQKIVSAQQTLQVALDALHAKKQEGISQYYQEQALMDQFLKDQDAETAAINKAAAANDAETASVQRKTQAKKDDRDSFSLAGGAPVPSKFAGMSNIQLHSMGYLDMYDRVTVMGEAAGLGDSGGPIRPRASGGPVEAGTPYLVGEQGPELFVPASNGSIAANGSAGVVVHNTFNIVDTESNIARRVSDQITRSVMRSARLS